MQEGDRGVHRVSVYDLQTLEDDSDNSSEITFGDVRDSRMDSELSWVPVSNPGFWQMDLKDILVDGNPMGLCLTGCQVRIADQIFYCCSLRKRTWLTGCLCV